MTLLRVCVAGVFCMRVAVCLTIDEEEGRVPWRERHVG
jgi:hypothetical protein